MKIKFGCRIFIYILVTGAALSAIALPFHFGKIEDYFDSLVNINYLDLLLGQVASTLIVLSLISVLSSNFGQVYWEDIKSKKLIEPFWGCFVGITTYLLTTMGYSVASYVLGVKAGVVISAIVAIVLLMVLTGKMIGIYFGREQLKKKLSVDYRKLVILNNYYIFPIKYARALEEFRDTIKKEAFPSKRSYLKKINREIDELLPDKRVLRRLEILKGKIAKINFPDKESLLKEIGEYIDKYINAVKCFHSQEAFCELSEGFNKIIASIKSIANGKNPKTNRFLTVINNIPKELDTLHVRYSRCYEDFNDKKNEASNEIKAIHEIIEEYTENAIRNNNTGVVKENIGLLVDSVSIDIFLNLFRELFEWDEKYACKELLHISRQYQKRMTIPKSGMITVDLNHEWLINEKMRFLKRHALHKLISQSSEIDAILGLLWVYEFTNKGRYEFRSIIKSLRGISDQLESVNKDNQKNDTDNDQSKEIKGLKDDLSRLDKELKDELEKAKANSENWRSFYIPIREAYVAYKEGKYETVNNYLTVLLKSFESDRHEINDVFYNFFEYSSLKDDLNDYTFSYVTDEEKKIIDRLIDSDRANKIIPKEIKKGLKGLKQVVINRQDSTNAELFDSVTYREP